MQIWKWSLHLGKIGLLFRAQIEKTCLPLQEPASFQELVEAREFARYACADPEQCLLSYVEKTPINPSRREVDKHKKANRQHVVEFLEKDMSWWNFNVEFMCINCSRLAD